MMNDMLSRLKAKESFYQSSSFKMAMLFTVLLFSAIVLLLYLSLSLPAKKLTSSWLFWLSLFMISFVSIFSFVIAVYVVRRIKLISLTAENIITTRRLEERIDINYDWDDLSKLAMLLNQLFDEVENLVADISQVSNNIAHDLRTPLTRLTNHLSEVEDDERRERLVHEANQLMQMFNGLLRIADIERTDGDKAYFQKVSLSSLLKDAIELYEPLAFDKGINIEYKLTNISVSCDKDLVFQAVVNLIDNAIKFSSHDGLVCIMLIEHESSVSIIVKDSGVGLEEDEFESVTKRFYRVDKTRQTQGHGLGLALVAAVAKRHDGCIRFSENNHQGLVATLKISK